MSTKTLSIENLGPVDELEINLPDGGGVTVLRGSNGSGKSTVLRGVSRLMGGSSKGLSVRDGEKKGVVELGDAVLSVTKSRAAARGELEVTGIEGRLDVAALVDPGIQDEEKADAKRLKALVGLSGVEASPSLFFDLCGGEGAYAALGVDDGTDDVLLLAARVKRAIENEARKMEKIADDEKAKANAIEAAFSDVDLEAPHDERELEEALTDAKAQLASYEKHNENASFAAEKYRLAVVDLERLPRPEPVDEIESDIQKLTALRDEEFRNYQRLKNEMEEAQKQHAKTCDKIDQRERDLSNSIDTAKRVEVLEEVIKSGISNPIQEETIQEQNSRIEVARQAVSLGATIRNAIAEKEKASAAVEESRRIGKLARQLRKQASAVEEVLSDLIPDGCPLRVEAGRLVTETDRSKSEPYAELSHGERWRLAIDLAADQLPENGLLTIPQEAWEGLSGENRELVAKHCRERGVNALTAAVSDDGLAVESL